MIMRVIQLESEEKLHELVAQEIIQRIQNNPKVVLGLATGSTPIGVYRKLVEDHKKNGTSYKQVTTFNLDEYIGLSPDHPQSYHAYMKEHLFEHIDIPSNQAHLPNGLASDLNVECQQYEQLIQQAGGIDLQILGIGLNGHIGFNEPGTPFSSETHVVRLTESTRQANSRFFTSIEEVPTHAITMGLNSIMRSKEIFLLITGKQKSEIFHRLMEENVSEVLPASILKHHPNVVVYVDHAAAGKSS